MSEIWFRVIHLGVIEIEVLIFLVIGPLYTPKNYVEDPKSFNLRRFHSSVFAMLEFKTDKNVTCLFILKIALIKPFH